MKKSITFRLFIITSVLLVIFTAGTYFIQTLFLGNFYVNKKTSHIAENVELFKKSYISKTYNLTEADEITAAVNGIATKFEEQNSARLMFLLSSTNQFYVTGTHMGDPNRVTEMYKVYQYWASNPKQLAAVISSGKPLNYIDNTGDPDVKNIIYVSPVMVKGECTGVIFAIASLQPVNEALSVVKEFYLYIFIFAGIITIILSLIYSRMISNPLIDLNKAALKMAQLDFSVRCSEDREDEIGNLSKTLNFLSGNLHNALENLETSNEKLKQDIEKERHLEKMRKEFVAGVSHELKTPISIIEGFAEGLKDNIAEGEDRDYYIDVIMDESKKMASLVSDMLDISQLESGNFKLIIKPFYIDELIESIRRKFTKIINEKNLILDIQVPGSFFVEGDRDRIEQVITNFLTNAVRYTKEGNTISVRLHDKGAYILVEVENQGEQIAEEELKNIWDKFYKIDKSRTREAGGTGLGLSIVKNILLLHNSDFGVRNTDNGVMFYFTLNKSYEVIENN